MGTNRVKGFFDNQDKQKSDPFNGADGLIVGYPHGNLDLVMPGPNGTIITEALNADSAAWRAVREVLEECMQYRHGPPRDVLEELTKRMRKLQLELMPQVFEALMKNKQFNPFGINLN